MKHIANILSFSRFLLALTLFLFINHPTGFITVYSICWFTDAIDGSIARATKSASELGSKIDDLADYTLLFTMIAIMLTRIYSDLGIATIYSLLPYLLALIAIRVGNVIFTKKKFKKVCIIHTYANKITSVLAFILPLEYLIFGSLYMAYTVLIFGIVASLEETLIHYTSDVYDYKVKSIFLKQKPPVSISGN